MKELTHKEYNALPIERRREMRNSLLSKLKIEIDNYGTLIATNLEYQNSQNVWNYTDDLSEWQYFQHRIEGE